MDAKPHPRITAVSRPFWEGCNSGKLLLQRCESQDCRRTIFYPRVCCPHCGHGSTEWFEARPTGRIVTFTIIHRPHHSSFYDEAPFIFAAIELDDTVLLYSRLECPTDQTENLIGQRVEAVFQDLGPEQKVPYFRLVP